MFEKSSIHFCFKKSSFFRKAQIIKKIKHFHKEEHSKESQELKERRKKTERKRNVRESVRCTSLSGGNQVDGSPPVCK